MCPQGHPHQLGPILSWHFPMVLNANAKNNSINLDLFTGVSYDKKKWNAYHTLEIIQTNKRGLNLNAEKKHFLCLVCVRVRYLLDWFPLHRLATINTNIHTFYIYAYTLHMLLSRAPSRSPPTPTRLLLSAEVAKVSLTVWQTMYNLLPVQCSPPRP